MCRLVRVIIIAVLLISSAGISCLAAGSGDPSKITIRHSLFYNRKEILVRDVYSTPTPYPAYQRKEYEYTVCCGAEAENPTDTDLDDVTIICQFRDKFSRVMRTDRLKVSIKAGRKIRMIFRSGLLNADMTGDQAYGGTMNSPMILSLEDESRFVNFAKDLDFTKNKSFAGVFNLTLTEVSCRFQLDYKNKNIDYKER